LTVEIPISRSYAVSFVVVGIALNIVASRLATLTGIPGIYLDLMGTFLTALILGPWWAAATGFFTNILNGIMFGPIGIPFAIVNVAFGLLTGYAAEHGWTKTWVKTAVVFVLSCFIVSFTASIIVVFVFGGATGSPQDIIVFALLSATGWGMFWSVFIADIAGKPIDMIIEYAVAFAILRALPGEYRLKTPYGKKK